MTSLHASGPRIGSKAGQAARAGSARVEAIANTKTDARFMADLGERGVYAAKEAVSPPG